MMFDTGGFVWPRDRHGDPVATVKDPVTGVEMCQDCWNGSHPRGACPVAACKCECYIGRNKGLAGPRYPRKECSENQSFPDVGGIQF